jgi:1,4-dihydroxy-2-naphthoate polyprenyltransferase
VIRAGLLSQKEVKVAGLFAFGIAIFFSFFLAEHSGWIIPAIVMLSAITGYCYTGGPYPICYLGLSEIFVFLFYGGVCVITSYYLQTGQVHIEVILIAMQMGLLAIIPNAINNFRDIYEDAENNKTTLAVRFGRNFARWEIAFLTAAPFLLNIFWLFLGYPLAFLAPYLLLPIAFLFVRSVWTTDPSPQFVRYFGLSVLIQVLFGILIILGLVWNLFP